MNNVVVSNNSKIHVFIIAISFITIASCKALSGINGILDFMILIGLFCCFVHCLFANSNRTVILSKYGVQYVDYKFRMQHYDWNQIYSVEHVNKGLIDFIRINTTENAKIIFLFSSLNFTNAVNYLSTCDYVNFIEK